MPVQLVVEIIHISKMGIKGLLPFLEKATKPCHISEFRGSTMAVDTYCWLHKGASSCPVELATGADTQSLVHYCMKYIKLLQSYDIKPILVFDGRNLPAKSETELKRREARNRAKQRAHELIKLGKNDEARSFLKQSVNITPEMASNVIKECHKLGIDCIVAPYESDAQLAFFSLKGVAEIIITEDSDLVLFGCAKVLYKLDLRGCGSLVDAEKIPLAMSMRPDNFTFDKFRYMCILSGCDYLDSLPGIGLKKALKFIKLTQETNPEIFLAKVPRYLSMRHLNVSEDYIRNFMIADATFKHQTVFDPYQKKLVPLIDQVVHCTDEKYCINVGKIFDQDEAYQIALGNKHPSSQEQLGNWSPTKSQKLARQSIWSGLCHKAKRKETAKQQTIQFKRRNSDVDEIKAQKDLDIEKEISVYFNKPKKPKIEQTSEKEPTSQQQEDRTSPVLIKNSFIKKLSKFKRTSTGDALVKSRYFSTPPEATTSSTDTTQFPHKASILDIAQSPDTASNTDMAPCTDTAPILDQTRSLDSSSSPDKKQSPVTATASSTGTTQCPVASSESETTQLPSTDTDIKIPVMDLENWAPNTSESLHRFPKVLPKPQKKTLGVRPRERGRQPTLYKFFETVKD